MASADHLVLAETTLVDSRQRSPSTQSRSQALDNTIGDRSGSAVDLDAEVESLLRFLSQPSNVLKRIPRLSRVTAARKLAIVVEQVVSRNDLPSWSRLLSFPKKCLHTPRRGGKRWSLSNLVNRQVSQESHEPPNSGLPDVQPPRNSRRRNWMEQLATRVSSKLEEGDYRDGSKVGM